MLSPIFFFFSLILSSSFAFTCARSTSVLQTTQLLKALQGTVAKLNPANVTVDDFVYSGLRVPGNTTNINQSGFTAAVAARSTSWPQRPRSAFRWLSQTWRSVELVRSIITAELQKS
ncbi:hypothetical protein M0R45_023917 [Rubus argutus]|uniref:Uncharacterized protein n=1 Tax=Rubus argutus TaxID=59490 RepID=A0AAW1WRK6_RUBAR